VGGFVGVDDLAVDGDLEDPAEALFQRCGDSELVCYRGLQTGGLREVVSLAAVFDLDLHSPLLLSKFTHSSY
jgi:hypothetical protein